MKGKLLTVSFLIMAAFLIGFSGATASHQEILMSVIFSMLAATCTFIAGVFFGLMNPVNKNKSER